MSSLFSLGMEMQDLSRDRDAGFVHAVLFLDFLFMEIFSGMFSEVVEVWFAGHRWKWTGLGVVFIQSTKKASESLFAL